MARRRSTARARRCGRMGTKSARSRFPFVSVAWLGYEPWGGGRWPKSGALRHVANRQAMRCSGFDAPRWRRRRPRLSWRKAPTRRSHRPWWLRRPDPGPSRLAPTLGRWPCRRSPRRSCSGRSRSARPTASFTSTASRAGAWVPSQRASGGRRVGSAAGSSRSRTSSCRSTAVAASSERSPVRHSSARTTRSASTRTASRSGWSASRRCSASTPRRSGTIARSSP